MCVGQVAAPVGRGWEIEAGQRSVIVSSRVDAYSVRPHP